MRPPEETGGERLGYGMSTVVISRRQRFDWKAALFFIGFTLLLGALGGLLGGASGFKSFEALQKPPLTPPAAVFPIVWSALYLLMGIAAYLVWSSGDLDRGASLRMYFLQLLVNILWPLFFFRLQWRLFAFFWLLLLLALLSLTMAGFRYIRKSSYWLLVPYFLWVLFAGYLNLGIYLLNMYKPPRIFECGAVLRPGLTSGGAFSFCWG